MFHPAVHDLVKPQWLAVLAHCKQAGAQTIGEIREATGTAYMTTKGYCEELANRGYLNRTRIPRTGTGRPEISYSLTAKADSVFGSVDASLSLTLLAEAKSLFGDIAPERMLHGWFQKLADLWRPAVVKFDDPLQKAQCLAKLRCQNGWICHCEESPLRLIDSHHPLHGIFTMHPRAKTIERRILEDLLGAKIRSREVSRGRGSQPVFLHEIG